jgi:hypothetical protein
VLFWPFTRPEDYARVLSLLGFLGVKIRSPRVQDVSSIVMLPLWCTVAFLLMVFLDTQRLPRSARRVCENLEE